MTGSGRGVRRRRIRRRMRRAAGLRVSVAVLQLVVSALCAAGDRSYRGHEARLLPLRPRPGRSPAELGRLHGIPPELHAAIYSGGDDAPLSPLGCRTLSYVFGCRGPGPFCNGAWCGGSPENQTRCNSLLQAGLGDQSKLMEAESVTRALDDATAGFKNLEEQGEALNVMGFLCEPAAAPWWPADPHTGPSPPRISDGPVSGLARDLAGKTMLMIGDSVIEQTCGAMVCAMRRDASLGARKSPLIPEWQRQLEHATLDGPVSFAWEAAATGFNLLCWRMNQYNNATFNSEARYRHLLGVVRPDVLVINHGAHHGGDIGAYTGNMQELLELIRELGFSRPGATAAVQAPGDKIFLWSATTAQHFDTPTGDFDTATQNQQGCYCADAKPGVSTISEKQAREMAALSWKFGFGSPFPMFQMTSGRFDLHLEECRNFMLRDPSTPDCGPQLARRTCDCTHLCYSPAFFDSVAGRLREALSGQRLRQHAFRHSGGVLRPVARGFQRALLTSWETFRESPALEEPGAADGDDTAALPSKMQLLPPGGPFTIRHLKLGTKGVFPDPGYHISKSRRAWKALAEKLRSGQGVSVHGIGSSVLGVHGGCSEPLPVLKQLCGACCTLAGSKVPPTDMSGLAAREGAGWARIAFDWLNRTWPSGQNRLLNAARAGGGAELFATCLNKNAPLLEEADLVLLEFGITGKNKEKHVESIIRQVMALKRQPALMMVQFVEWCRGEGSPGLCEGDPEGPPVSIGSFLDHAIPADTEHERLAHHYDVPLVSTVEFLWPVMFPGLPLEEARMGALTEPSDRETAPPVQLASRDHSKRVFGDGTHPTNPGSAVIGSLVTYGMHVALLASAHHQGSAHQQGSGSRALPMPSPILADNSRMVGARCYSFIRGLGRSNFSVIPDHQLHEILTDWPPVTRFAGFEYVDAIPNREGQLRWKPGFVSTIPGSYVELGLDLSTWDGPPQDAAGESTEQEPETGKATYQAHITYLKSYEHMGQAAITCKGGCSCNKRVMDAHTMERNSVTNGMQVELQRLEGRTDCTLRIEVLHSSSSGEYKFKLVQLSLQKHIVE